MIDQTNDANAKADIINGPLPTGLMMALAQNMHAMTDYAKLPDEAKARLIEQASNTHSRKDMQALVRNLGQFL